MSLEEWGFRTDMLLNPLVAAFCGAMLGWNRELKGRAAGLRTQTLVCLGACVLTMTALELAARYPDSNFDPLRAVSGIAGGLGFLGAGSIVQAGGSVKGVTTAATVWISGTIGLTCGIGWYPMAAITMVLTLVTLSCLGIFTHFIEKERRPRPVIITEVQGGLQNVKELKQHAD